jgi:hypothetical protein
MRLRRTLAKMLSAILALLVGISPIGASAFTLQSVQLKTVNLIAAPSSNAVNATSNAALGIAPRKADNPDVDLVTLATKLQSTLHNVTFPQIPLSPSIESKRLPMMQQPNISAANVAPANTLHSLLSGRPTKRWCMDIGGGRMCPTHGLRSGGPYRMRPTQSKHPIQDMDGNIDFGDLVFIGL